MDPKENAASEVVPSGAQPPSSPLIAEVVAFRADCMHRYRFNDRWDIVLSTLGILLSIAVVGAGFYKNPLLSAVLGAIVGAVVTAQKAFPFGQRSSFYRLLIGQADNIFTRANQGLWTTVQVVDALSILRMDFAQQLPRGSTSQSHDPITAPDPSVAGDKKTDKITTASDG